MRDAGSTRWRLGFVCTITLAMCVGGFVQFTLGALGPVLIDELALSRTQLGSLTTALYLVAGLCSPVVGSLVDVMGGRRLLLVLFATAAVAQLVLAAADTYQIVLVAAAVAGAALAISNPVTNQLIGVHLRPGDRGTIMGVKQSGAQLAALVAGAVVPWGAVVYGWRMVVVAALVLPLAGLLGTWWVVPTGSAGNQGKPSWSERGTAVWWLSTYAFFMGGGTAAVVAYLPLYGFERVGLSVRAAGWAVALPGLVGVVTRILLGRVVERLASVALPLVALGVCAMVSLLLVLAAEAGGPWLLWAGAVGIGASAIAWPVVGMLSLLRTTSLGLAGRASGVLLLSTFAGFVSSPVVVGVSVDASGSYTVGWTIVTLLFAGALTTALLWRARERSNSGLRTKGE